MHRLALTSLLLVFCFAPGCAKRAGNYSYASEAPMMEDVAATEAAPMKRKDGGGSIFGADDPAAVAPAMGPGGGGEMERALSDASGAATAQPPKTPTPAADQDPAPESATSDDPDPAGVGAMLIFTGQMHTRVPAKEISARIERAADIAVAAGGYVSKQDDHAVELRVPSKKFRKTMKKLDGVGETIHRAVQAQDVSEEFHDLEIRLGSLRATRDRLQKFLDRAKTIEEVLRLEAELGRIAAQIDQIEGRMRFLGARVAFSTISMSFEAIAEPVVIADGDEPPPPPDAQTLALPIEWIPAVGLHNLLSLDS